MASLESHPFSNFINKLNNLIGGFLPFGLKILVVGTFPPKKEYEEKQNGFFFFSSARNHLWNRFDNIFCFIAKYIGLKKTSILNKDESFLENRIRKETFCASKGIGFIDIFSKILRKVDGSTKDSDLISIENILENGSFQAIIRKEDIDRVCCVYALAYDTLKNEMLSRDEFKVAVVLDNDTANGEKLQVDAFGKTFEVVLLYPATRSRHKGELKDRQYRKFLQPRTVVEDKQK